MKQRHFRLPLTIVLLAVTTLLPISAGAQEPPSSWDLILGRKPKVKDYNQAPDKNEFQLPTNGEYKANPTFFAARNDNERCQAIDLWLSSIRYEASQASYNRRYQRNNDDIDMERVNKRQIQRYATTFFRNIFGKGLSELSEKEMEKVAKSLDKCSHQRWVLGTLENPFRYPVQMRDWVADFNKIEDSIKDEKLKAQQEAYREHFQTEARRTGYNVAELLTDGGSFQLHTAFLNDGRTNWCSPTERQAVTALILNVDDKSAVENSESYWRTFEKDLLPAIRSKCAEAEKIYVLNYVRGFYISYDRNLIQSGANPAYPSDPLNIAVYSANQSGTSQRGWINGDSMSNLIGSTSRRTQRAVTFSNSDSQLSNANLVTISSLRNFLAARKAKLDEEARIRAEKEAAAEAARRAEIARKAEARRVQLATGGFSTTGLKNAELFANIFLGDFQALPFERDSLEFSTLYGAYLKSYSESCELPVSNRVEMTERYCSGGWTTNETRTLSGITLSSNTTCNQWSTRGTGRFADPEMYAAKSTLDRLQLSKVLNPKSGGGALGGLVEALTDFASGKTLNEMGKAIDVSSDVAPLVSMNVSMNTCSSRGLKRFQENLRRFALNENPLLEPLPPARTEIAPVKTESEKPQPVVQKAKPVAQKARPAVKKKQAKPPAKKDPFKGVVIPNRY
jgi:hypothetical protein